MQEVFEKIKEKLSDYPMWKKEMIYDLTHREHEIINKAIEIVNQVESEYQSTVGPVKCDASFSDGYIKGIDDAIEKFLEYGCFCIEWNPKLSKEKLVDDVMRQVRGQSVYILEKLKQKAEEYNQSLTNGDKIRNMTNEELADFLSVNAFCDCCSIRDKCDAYQEDSCKNVFIKWLQSKAEE